MKIKKALLLCHAFQKALQRKQERLYLSSPDSCTFPSTTLLHVICKTNKQTKKNPKVPSRPPLQGSQELLNRSWSHLWLLPTVWSVNTGTGKLRLTPCSTCLRWDQHILYSLHSQGYVAAPILPAGLRTSSRRDKWVFWQQYKLEPMLRGDLARSPSELCCSWIRGLGNQWENIPSPGTGQECRV